MRPLSALTSKGRARRLRPLALAALAQYPVVPRRLRLIGNSWNCVFRVDTADGPLVLRVGLPTSAGDGSRVRAEAEFLLALTRAGSVLVPTPRANRDGLFVTTASAPGVPEPRHCVLFTWVPGIDLAQAITPERWSLLGGLMARLHTFAEGWTPPTALPIPRHDRLFHRGEPCVLFDAQHAHRFSAARIAALRQAVELADARTQQIWAREPSIVTHGDLHQWNVKLHRGSLHPIDFEDLLHSPPILDVATSLYYVHRRPDFPALRASFQAGYSALRPWVEREPGELTPLILARGLELLNVCLFDPEIGPAAIGPLIPRVADDAANLIETLAG